MRISRISVSPGNFLQKIPGLSTGHLRTVVTPERRGIRVLRIVHRVNVCEARGDREMLVSNVKSEGNTAK